MAKKEKPVPFMVRLYKKEKIIIRRISRNTGYSKANVIRAAILAYGDQFKSCR